MKRTDLWWALALIVMAVLAALIAVWFGSGGGIGSAPQVAVATL